MTPDEVATETQAPPQVSEKRDPPLKILVVTATLVPGRAFPAPVEFANALVTEGMSVMLAAAVGPLRTGLSRTVGYLLVDDAEQAPVKTAHELSRLVHHHQPDVVHAHGARCAVVSAVAIKACRAKCARVMTLYSPGLQRIPRWIKGPILRHCADRYFAASEALAGELESLGVSAERIRLEPVDERHASQFAHESVAVYRDIVGSKRGASQPPRV
jgi:hypothetical protein